MSALTVVHVDDDPAVLELSHRLFERRFREDVALHTFDDPGDALAYVIGHEVHCVVSDSVYLPTGELFVAALGDRHPTLPTILLTAREWDEVAPDVDAASVLDHVRKGGRDDFDRVLDHVAALVDASPVAPLSSPVARGRPPSTHSDGAWASLDYHEWAESTPDEFAVSLAETVAALRGVDVDALPPLFDAVDVDALGALFGSGDAGHVCVSFTYAGYEVVLTDDGLVALR